MFIKPIFSEDSDYLYLFYIFLFLVIVSMAVAMDFEVAFWHSAGIVMGKI